MKEVRAQPRDNDNDDDDYDGNDDVVDDAMCSLATSVRVAVDGGAR